MSLHTQFVTLGMMIVSGVGLSIGFEVYHAVCERLKLARWLISTIDLIYWLSAAVVVFKVLLYSNHGELRIFIFLGLGIGLIMYILSLRTITIRLIELLLRLIEGIIRIFVKVFHRLVITPLLLVYRLIMIIYGFFAALSIFIYKIVLQWLNPLWKIFQHLFKKKKEPYE